MKAHLASTVAALVLIEIGCGSSSLTGTGSLLRLEPKAVHFGEILIGDQEAQTVQITSLSRRTVHVRVTASSPEFEVEPSAFILPPASSQVMEVRYRATRLGRSAANLIFSADDGEAVQLAVEGRATNVALETVSILSFGRVPMWKTETIEVEVQNLLEREIDVSIDLSGSTDFTGIPASMHFGPRQLQSFPLRFRPSTVGVAEARIGLAACGGCPRQSISIHGEGLAKELISMPSSMDFGPVAVGLNREDEFTLRNVGPVDVEFTLQVARDAPFQIVREGTGHLRPLDSTNVRVRFSPRGRGLSTAEITVIDSTGSNLAEVRLQGEGVASVEAYPTFVDFVQPRGMRIEKSIELRAVDRSREVLIEDVRLTGADAQMFELVFDPSGRSIGRSNQHVIFAYDASFEGEVSAEAVVALRDSLSKEVRVQLHGRPHDEPCSLRASHSTIDFGWVPRMPMSRQFDLQNVGAETCFIWGFRISPEAFGALFVDAPDTYYLLDPGEFYSVMVYWPGIYQSSGYSLRYRHSSLDQAEVVVPIFSRNVGVQLEDLFVTPSTTVVLPTTPVGGRSTAFLEVGTHGAPHPVADVSLSDDSSLNFSLVNYPRDLPHLITVEDPFTVEIEFAPVSPGRSYGQVLVGGVSFPIRFDLKGESVIGPLDE